MIANALRARASMALRELLGGLRDEGPALRGHEGAVGEGLVTAIVRMAFALFAEGRGLLPREDDRYARELSLGGLHAELGRDRDRPGTGRGAWARVVALFRAIHGGASLAGGLALPARGGRLFDPDAHPFLEGRVPWCAAPPIPDGALLRALDALVGQGDERLDFGQLDVEHLGAVYEGLIGHRVGVARGPSLALDPDDVVVDLEDLAARSGPDRIGFLAEEAGIEVKGRVARAVTAATDAEGLARALAPRSSARGRGVIPAGAPFLQPSEARRRSGAHYTSRAITKRMVERTLAPLLRGEPSPDQVVALRVCDPAMGSGAFLLEACRCLAEALVRAWERAGAPPGGEALDLAALRAVARQCLFGVDKDPLAVDLARASLWLLARASEHPLSFVDHALRAGDALVGPPPGEPPRAGIAELVARVAVDHAPFDWAAELPEVFARGGFDAVVGNPPWVAYVGRAAQPLDEPRRALYGATSPAFAGYRTLQGVFVHRAATLLRPGGRLGFVLPTSMSDLDGYEPSRRAHDALCAPDPDLPDFGDDAFEGVFQPSMGLFSTRRADPVALDEAGPWPLERRDLDAGAAALLDRLARLPRLPEHLFGERGFQTSSGDAKQLRAIASPEGAFTTPLRVGSDVEPFLRRPPGLHCDPRALSGRFRPEVEWRAVKLLLRQTARWPMATLSDGLPFRNSILAGFADEAHSPHFLLAYLNSTPIRWFHYTRNRDARQGMPQLKIAHLRALPAPIAGARAILALEEIGRVLGERNAGVTADEQAGIDRLAADALDLGEGERAIVGAWSIAMRSRPG